MSHRLVAVFTPFEDLTDPRMARTRVHDLFDLVVVALCGTIAGADTWADIERFGHERLDWLRTFLRLEGGIASHDTFGRVFALLDPAELVACVAQWLDDIGCDIGTHIAIDGKMLRGSFDTAAGKNPLHLVSAWATEARLTLGQVAVDGKSNEIAAIPLLWELLDLKGATVTIDAMGCQKEIAANIVHRRESDSTAPRAANLGRVAASGRVHPRGGHLGERYSPRQTRPRGPLHRRPGKTTPQFRGDLDAIAVGGTHLHKRH